MDKVYLLIGGNIGDRLATMNGAVAMIHRKAGRIKAASTVYETAPWGMKAQSDFLNCAIEIDTDHNPNSLLTVLLSIESDLGRIRSLEGYESRTIDIDILFFGNLMIDLPELKLPHPRLHLRKFVLEPLVELCPEFIHPVFGVSISQLYSACDDHLPVRPFVGRIQIPANYEL